MRVWTGTPDHYNICRKPASVLLFFTFGFPLIPLSYLFYYTYHRPHLNRQPLFYGDQWKRCRLDAFYDKGLAFSHFTSAFFQAIVSYLGFSDSKSSIQEIEKKSL